MRQFKGTREAFSAALMDMREQDDRVMFVSADSLKAMRATAFEEAYPESCVEAGIAEQAAVAAAAGMASCGLKPFVATYAGFLTMRACEQMRTFVAYPNLNVKFAGINAGLIGGEREGVTHQFYEDMSILSAIPNFTILVPADGAQAYRACRYAMEVDGPVYVRLGSGREPDVYSSEAPFSTDGFTVLRDWGNDVTVFACGFILDRVLAAADELRQRGVGVKVADVNILRGADDGKLIELIKSARSIVSVEDHNVNGALGSKLACLAAEHHPLPVRRIGLTAFGESGAAKELADHYGFSPEDLAQAIGSCAGIK